MTISKRVQQELVLAKPADVAVAPPPLADAPKRITKTFLKTTREAKTRREAIAARTKGQAWTAEEHARFLEALQVYPSGPWEAVAEYVGTKNSRQTMTHAQKYRQKHERQQRGLRVQTKPTHKKGSRDVVSPYPSPVKRADLRSHKPAALWITPVASPADDRESVEEAESPRSSEDECGQLLPPIDLDLFSSSMMLDDTVDDATPIKLDSASVLDQLFQDFEPHAQALQMWSTNSLSDKFDELSALPEDFSQALGLWVP